jgi:hypothetical protein
LEKRQGESELVENPMPNAIVRANARTMSEATNRRAILGAILTAGAAAGLPAALATTATAAPTLSLLDRRVEDLWLRRRRLKAIADHLNDQYDALDASMPPFIGRLDLQGILNEHRGALDHEMARSLAKWATCVLEREEAAERNGLSKYGERADRAENLINDIESTLKERMGESALALAAVLVAEIQSCAREDVPGLAAASLAAIRPQISGPIAEDADRVLAKRDDDGEDGPSAAETGGRAGC